MKRSVLAYLLCLPGVACGEEPSGPNERPAYLQAYESNYAMYRRASPDKNTFTAHYSFRYLLSEPVNPGTQQPQGCALATFWHCKPEYFAAYTGEFDFYWNTRPSSPVINRINNPALHMRWIAEQLSWFDLGLEHRSDGQSLDIKDADVRARADQAYRSGDRAFFDTISRSANYLSFTGAWPGPGSTQNQGGQLMLQLKQYVFGEESDVTWGPLSHSHPRFADYDRLRISAIAWRSDGTEFSLHWSLGNKGLKTDSANADLAFRVRGTPTLTMYLRYHHGPMFTLSNYTQPQNSIGIGFKLIPFANAHGFNPAPY
ncbi:hypothetical protein [Pseudoduganella violaceinigra]|uniref:hypothetical protein n=1 Tax=Pseudoduganella violaceinigra TaxID=246602 RepID=UPI000489C928|nr:hypothetical protein [Pseudoduganella violaceinigra]